MESQEQGWDKQNPAPTLPLPYPLKSHAQGDEDFYNNTFLSKTTIVSLKTENN